MATAGPPTRRSDEEERITLMKSRDQRAVDFLKVFLSSASSPEFITKNVKIKDTDVAAVSCHCGDRSN